MPQSNDIIQYMVEFRVPDPITQEIISLIPDQREVVETLFTGGKLVIYSLAQDRSKLWAIFVASSESELLNLIDRLPLSSYMDYDYHQLMFHQSVQLLPALSLN